MATASDLGKGSTFIHQGEPVRVTKKEVVAVGTHSHTKLKLFVKPVFTSGGEKIITLAHQDKVEIVEIPKKTATIISKQPLQIMDSQSYETFDAQADENILSEINEGDEIIFVDYRGKVKVLEKK